MRGVEVNVSAGLDLLVLGGGGGGGKTRRDGLGGKDEMPYGRTIWVRGERQNGIR